MKNIRKQIIAGIFISSLIFVTLGCEKFLDEKSDASLSIPETFKDLRATMNYEGQINRSFPTLLEAGSDDYYVKSNILNARSESERLVYTWKNSLQRSDIASWSTLYNTILISNIVLEGLERISEGSDEERKTLKGEALFIRSYAIFNLSQIFCLPYDEVNKNIFPGLPLRTSSDYGQHFDRSSMAETYEFVVNGLMMSFELLPENVQFKSRASKSAALGALARVYLTMGKFDQANEYAREALSYNRALIDYNDLDKSLRIPFSVDNSEIIYYAFCTSGYFLASSRAFIPRDLYDLYEEDDLRKVLFYNRSNNGDIQFKGNYDGVGGSYFAGIATDELYLVRAECEIRAGNVSDGLALLNQLLKFRYEKDTFIGHTNLNQEEALELVLSERRKQLVRRGIRWMDLRRLLKEPGRVPALFRKADNGMDVGEYVLEPKINNYVYPIPDNVIRIQNYEQNPL
ncbi:RagB/SusD family nutrient uptake outer membrane protein [Sphingobacterium olei]|uniref:RagB/SusD family nutrient uptake outer membrane protein n=1 Tax=Sphingobacterium olei TaxID=2571155 RepID=A0A4U0NHR4_9SPHI|nr:RagB/SusD family nutrient uptake outer membrane protein [Sphingobacterium olei]TJZ53781.1 RagB/SusD family nutrient uptake outer membrane protein [Sphingobacterium olei]